MTRIGHPCVGIEDAATSMVHVDAQMTLIICPEMRLKKYREGNDIVLIRSKIAQVEVSDFDDEELFRA